MLPAFHGEKMERLSGLMREVAEREVAAWPRDEPVALHPRLQALTLEVILRAVFGLDAGERLDALASRLTSILEFGARPASMLPLFQRPRAAVARVRAAACGGRRADLRADRRAARRRTAIATTCCRCCSTRGTRTARRCRTQELRDELMTLLVAGHETTASELAWAFERLARDARGAGTARR